MAKLDELPPELALRICSLCRPETIALLGATSQALRAIAISDDIWRPRCEALWLKHAHPGQKSNAFASDELKGSYWKAWHSFFGPYAAPYLGWWAVTGNARGRLIRFTIESSGSEVPFRLVASLVGLINQLLQPSTEPPAVPLHAIMHSSGGFYLPPWPHYPQHPERDMLVDLLVPEVKYTPIFVVDASFGPHIEIAEDYRVRIRLDCDSVYRSHYGQNAEGSRNEQNGLPTRALLDLGGIRWLTATDGLASDGRALDTISWAVANDAMTDPFQQPSSPTSLIRGMLAIFQRPPNSAPGEVVNLTHQLESGTRMSQAFWSTSTGVQGSAGQSYIPIHGALHCSPTIWHKQHPGLVHGSSLTGLWGASYGPHGFEFIWINFDATSSILTALKLTGDVNVPAGEITWRTDDELEEGIWLPTTTDEELLRLTDGPEADHAKCATVGRVAAWGRIAGHSYTSPSWTPAHAIFLRSERGGQTVVDEIRTPWHALGHIRRLKGNLALALSRNQTALTAMQRPGLRTTRNV